MIVAFFGLDFNAYDIYSKWKLDADNLKSPIEHTLKVKLKNGLLNSEN